MGNELKGFKVQIEIIAAIFDLISKQQVNLSLFPSDWYCRNLGLTELLAYRGKVMSDKKMIYNSY